MEREVGDGMERWWDEPMLAVLCRDSLRPAPREICRSSRRPWRRSMKSGGGTRKSSDPERRARVSENVRDTGAESDLPSIDVIMLSKTSCFVEP